MLVGASGSGVRSGARASPSRRTTSNGRWSARANMRIRGATRDARREKAKSTVELPCITTGRLRAMLWAMTRSDARRFASGVQPHAGPRAHAARREIGGRLPLRNPRTSLHWPKMIGQKLQVDDREGRTRERSAVEGGPTLRWDARTPQCACVGRRDASSIARAQRMRDCDDSR
jgi:hypothetical protein